MNYIRLVARAVLAALAVMPRLIWKAGKWTLESFLPRPPAEAAMAMGALDEALAPAASPTTEQAKPAVDPAADWGAIAHCYAKSQVIASSDEADLSGLDEAARSWLTTRSIMDLRHILSFPAKEVGRHMFGEALLPDLKPCPTLSEHYARLKEEATPGTAAYVARADEASMMEEILEGFRASGRLGIYRGV